MSKALDNAEDGDRYRAPALDKGLDILELLAEHPDGLTRAEIVKELGRGPSEIYRMLERLVARQYVMRSAGGDRHALSLKMFALAHRLAQGLNGGVFNAWLAADLLSTGGAVDQQFGDQAVAGLATGQALRFMILDQSLQLRA